jgi:hypothetical protein
MKKTKAPAKRVRNKKAIRALAEALDDVLDAFGWYGIAVAEVVPTAEPQPPSPVTPSFPSSDGSDAIEASFEHSEESEEDHHYENDDENDYEDDYEDPSYADPETIQTAVDEAISSLMKEGMLPQFEGAKQAPSLSGVFAVLFGEEHDLTKQVEYFEELINGYEDRASMDDLREAHEVLVEFSKRLDQKENDRRDRHE